MVPCVILAAGKAIRYLEKVHCTAAAKEDGMDLFLLARKVAATLAKLDKKHISN